MKFVWVITVVSIMLNLTDITAFAAVQTNVSIGRADALVGESVAIPVTLSGNTGFSNLAIEISYNDDVLELIDVSAEAGIDAAFTSAPTLIQNPYNMQWDSASDITYNGILATLSFRVKNATTGTYPITVSYYKGRNGDNTDGEDVNYNADFEPLSITYKSGNISVTDGAATNGITVILGEKEINFHSNHAVSGVVLVAAYNSNDRLLKLKKYSAEKVVYAEPQTGSAYVKIMWWENFNFMEPVCVSQKIMLQ